MTTGLGPDEDRVRAEHCQRVFEGYENRAKAFRNVFTGVLIFALFFFAFVLVPYVSMQARTYRLAREVEAKQAVLKQRLNRVELYRRPKKGIEQLRAEIGRGPTELREHIGRLAADGAVAAPQIQQVAPAPPAPCQGLAREDWMNCMVREKVREQFARYDRILATDVIEPMTKLGPTVNRAGLEEHLAQLKRSFETHLAENPRFWRTREEKAGFSVSLDRDVERFWKDVGTTLETEMARLADEIQALEVESSALLAEQKRLSGRQEALEARLRDIESPLGKLPIGLVESILVFPVVLAVAFVACVFMHCETVRLRQSFHRLYQARDPARTILTDAEVALVAPLWVDPMGPKQYRTARIALLLLPVAVFAAACALIRHVWSLPATFSGQLPGWIYASLYGVAAIAILVALAQLARTLRGYRTTHA